VEWMRLAEDRGQWKDHMDTLMNLWVPYMAVSFCSLKFVLMIPHQFDFMTFHHKEAGSAV
jgi:hypothetical protein